MDKLGGVGMIVLGVIIGLLGVLLMTDLLDWLLGLAGFILLGVGVVMVIIGIVSRGNNRGSL